MAFDMQDINAKQLTRWCHFKTLLLMRHLLPLTQMFLRPIIIPSLPVYRSLSSKFFQRGCVSAVFSYDSTSHMLTITNMYTLACICTDT